MHYTEKQIFDTGVRLMDTETEPDTTLEFLACLAVLLTGRGHNGPSMVAEHQGAFLIALDAGFPMGQIADAAAISLELVKK